jgi:hypothetical protein
MNIRAANQKYERWLRAELAGDVVEDDLRHKHKAMKKGPFVFLRATYWRWAETILELCPDLAGAPAVLAVGDVHLENFGTWRDIEGRVVWGVNDYDEAAIMPYILDLVRLATSAVLAKPPSSLPVNDICASILDGYLHGLAAPEAFVLDREHMWLRKRFVVSEAFRAAFWKKMQAKHRGVTAQKKVERPPKAYRRVFAGALPEDGVQLVYWRRAAGTGSLGRPRWVGYGLWRGAPLLREVKALVPSGWTRVHGGSRRLRVNDIAGGRYRSPDPWYAARGSLLVRRLSPNNRKLEIDDDLGAKELLDPDMLSAMGRELAAVHLGVDDRRDAVRADLEARKRRSFRRHVETAAEFVRGEQREWGKGE